MAKKSVSIRNLIFLFGLLGSVLTPVLLGAQSAALLQKDIIFEQLPKELGLSQRAINCITQDREGYLWIGTWSGLVRYDGYTTKIFQLNNKAPKSLKSNKVTSILEDKGGNLWIGTLNGGLFLYEKGLDTFVQYKHDPHNPQSLGNNNVWCMLEDSSGNFWVGTSDGLYLFAPKKGTFKRIEAFEAGLSDRYSNFVTALHQSKSGKIWVGTERGLSLLKLPAKRNQDFLFERFIYEEDEPGYYQHNYIYSIGDVLLDGQETIWLSTIKGLKKFVNGQFQNFEYEDKAPGYNHFRSLLVAAGPNPCILLGSEKGISLFNPGEGRFTRFLGDQSQRVNLSQNTVTALYLDRARVLWVGTKTGINKYDTYSKNFELYPTSSFDKSKSIITGIRPAKAGGYWIGTLGGGIYKFNPAGQLPETGNPLFTPYKINCPDKSEFTDFVQTLHTDGSGNVWVGTAGAGVYRFQEDKLQQGSLNISEADHYTDRTALSISHNYVMSFANAPNGAVWMGSWGGGLNKIIPGDTIIHYQGPPFNQAPLVVMHTDRQGDLWIGTRGEGLYRVREQQHKLEVKVYQELQGLENKFVDALYEDQAGTLWIGTEGGLYAWDQKTDRVKFHKVGEGEENDVIVNILQDDSGKLWLAHWNGITVYDPARGQVTSRYNTEDRVQGGFFYNNVAYKSPGGSLLFGGAAGLNVIDPQAITINPVLATPRIERFRVFNEDVQVGKALNGRVILDKPLAEADKIVLKHVENSVSFEFSALHFAAPEKIKYAYILEGFDKDWQYTDASRRYVNYTNLPQGAYTFKVKATNNDGVWSEALSQLRFVVSPPWWKTDWAMLLYILAGVIILYLFRMFIIMRTTFIHNLKMERMKRENLETLSKAKLEFFTNVSHEFRTPLTLIAGPLQRVLESGEGNKFIRQQLVVVNNNTQRLLRLVNQLLDFRTIEAGNLKLQAAEGDIVRFAREIKLSFEGLAEQLQIDFCFKASEEDIEVWFDRDQFEKILYNLLSNAFKNTPKGGRVGLEISQNQQEVMISIEDNGRGIHPDHIENIFKRFYSYYEHASESGTSTGIGLALTKSLVDLHHGKIKVESEKGKFSRFTVSLLKGRAHLSPAEIAEDFRDSEHIGHYPPEAVALAVPPMLAEHIHAEHIHAEHIHAEHIHAEQVPAAAACLEQQKVLIVEDNAEVRAYVKSVFMGKYHILEAENGKEGLQLAQDEMPDLIISDIMMPVMDGIALCRKLKSKIKTSHIPIILLTARTSLIFKVEGLETGADDYITKPFDTRILELKVNNLLKLRASMRSMFQDSKVLQIEPQKVTLTSHDEQFIKKAIRSVEDNIASTSYVVEDLERDVNLSRMQLYHKLKALTGQSANEFIRTIRLKRAAQLIAQNQLTIAEVTYEVGFTDLQYFRKCFKKQFGVNPSEYASQQPAQDDVTVP